MEQNFKRIADSVRLPDGSRTRIRAQIASHREKQEASIMKTKKHLPRLAIALIVAPGTIADSGCRSLCIPQLDPRI